MGAALLQKSCERPEIGEQSSEECVLESERSEYPRHRMLLVSSSIEPFQTELKKLLAPRLCSNRGIKVICIPDAVIGNGYDARASYARVASEFRYVNVAEMCCVELRGNSPSRLAQQFIGVDCIYIDVGNTFYLLYYMLQSGFDKLVSRLLDDGVVYIGASAGAIAAGRTISTAFWKGWDPPGYGEEWDLSQIGYDGLNLLPEEKSIFPHYAPQWKNLVRTQRRGLDHELVVLDEENCYVVQCGEEFHFPHAVIVS